MCSAMDVTPQLRQNGLKRLPITDVAKALRYCQTKYTLNEVFKFGMFNAFK